VGGIKEAVRIVESRLSERDMADLSALADGTLAPERRAEVEARVAASAELQEHLDRQRQSLAATRLLAREPVPASLTTSVTAGLEKRRPGEHRPARQRRRLVLGLSGFGALIAAVAVVLVLTLGGPAAPSVADTAQLAIQAPTGPAPTALGTGGTRLAASVQGVGFPDLAHTFGWQATGIRHGTVGGRTVTVVSYEKNGRRIAYAIVAGQSLAPPSEGHSTTVDGIRYQSLTIRGRPAVVWQREGHTCVLIGAASPHELVALASWSTEAY